MGFKKVTIGEVCDLGDGAHSKVKRQESGIPYLTSKNIKKGYLDLAKIDYISEEDYFKLFSPTDKSVKDLRTGDILVGIIGTFGNVYLYKNSDKFGISSSIGILRPKKEIILPEFLYFQVKSELFSRTVEMIKGGSVQGYTNIPTLKTIPVYLPNLNVQQKIVEILSILEEKINTNLSIISNLEELSQRLFNRWFIDFEFPNEQGLPYCSSGGEMVESELGEIPKGWSASYISELGEIIGGGTPSKKQEEYYTDNGIPWITPKDLSVNKSKFIYKGMQDISELGLTKSSAKLMPKGTVLLSSRAPIGYIAIAGTEVTTNQGFKSIIPNKGYSEYFIYFKLKEMLPIIEANAGGSTFKEISGSGLKVIQIVLPKIEIVNKFNEVVGVLFDQIKLFEAQTENLVSLRDSLLPKLLSGEIKIPEESVVES